MKKLNNQDDDELEIDIVNWSEEIKKLIEFSNFNLFIL